MGMTWRITMPLLSTLAAMVIIVHSAEDAVQREYRYDLRPRILERRPSNFEEPWRVTEPLKQPTMADTWNNDPQEEPPVRRRTGRKRKRRPPADITDDVETKIQYTNSDDDPVPHSYDNPSEDNVETPRRRRKKMKVRPNRWIDETTDGEVPLRRRLQRRKRPSLNSWPELSEFGGTVRDVEADVSEVAMQNYDAYEDRGVGEHVYRGIDDEYADKEIKIHITRPKSKFSESETEEPTILVREDKSLSEFSSEVMSPNDEPKRYGKNFYYKKTEAKINEKTPLSSYGFNKAMDREPIDPQTLKDILKKSNGTSLSEILQQHNLSLADLLSGKENAISVLQSEKVLQIEANEAVSEETDKNYNFKNNNVTIGLQDKVANEVKEKVINSSDNEYAGLNQDSNSQNTSMTTTDSYSVESQNITISEDRYYDQNSKNKKHVVKVNNPDSSMVQTDIQSPLKAENSTIGMLSKRRFPNGIRRKLRMRPMLNTTYKSQLNRDLIALSARRYVHHNRRNTTKAKEWKDMIPLMPNLNLTDNNVTVMNESVTMTTTSVPEEITTFTALDEIMPSTIPNDAVNIYNNADNETTTLNDEEVETTTITLEILESEIPSNMTEVPIVIPSLKGAVNASGLRRQAYNNRLRKKRLKNKFSTTETPDGFMKNFLNMGDYVSSSEFIAKTHLPKFTSPNVNRDTVTELEDFMTTETTRQTTTKYLNSAKPNSHESTLKPSTTTEYPFTVTTEETAKIELEEILNDTPTSAKLSKILKERNMTLNELLDHRERGSSHVHLADIFHNASREPNPPEPFLTKSLLEPISKEIYPLRALLDANSHDTTTKARNVDPNVILTNHLTIPVIMDFGNNVNENAENMGIMSLFPNFTKDATEGTNKTTLQQDSEGTPYKSTVIHVNATDDDSDTRESRMMNDDQDMVSWNEIFTMIRKHNKNETNNLEQFGADNRKETYDTQKKITLKTDVDGDGLIVLEDLQHLRELDSNVLTSSEEKVDFNSYESSELPHVHTINNKIPSTTKSVTVAVASIVGLAMVLFLLTYAAMKWKQQRAMNQKHSYCDDRIPTPVFENRKIKKNCSSRSISPMLPTSNIYTMNTMESQNGKDSPEYMWDSLRKPFQ